MPFAPPPFPRFYLAPLLRVIFAGLALTLAGTWLTQLLAPRPVATLPVTFAADRVSPGEVASRLFGASPPGIAGATLIHGVRLTGIYAGPGGGGFASFQTPSGGRGVFPGQEIQPGVVLSSLHPDHVVLLAGGQETRLDLRPPAPSSSPP